MHGSAWNKYPPPCTCNFGELSFLHNWMFTVLALHLPVSKRYAPAAQPANAAAEAQLLPSYTKVRTLPLSFLAVFHNCCHSRSRQLAVKLYVYLRSAYTRAAIALNHSVKNNYTLPERRTPDNWGEPERASHLWIKRKIVYLHICLYIYKKIKKKH